MVEDSLFYCTFMFVLGGMVVVGNVLVSMVVDSNVLGGMLRYQTVSAFYDSRRHGLFSEFNLLINFSSCHRLLINTI